MNSTNATEAEWSHRCMRCGNVFQASGLVDPCPNCQSTVRRETTSLNEYLNECFGPQPSDDWPTILALEDFSNPVENPGE